MSKKKNYTGLSSLPFEEFDDAPAPGFDVPGEEGLGDFEFVSAAPAAPVMPRPEAPSPSAPSDTGAPVVRYMSFGSGSSGNSCYVATEQGGLIIDAGVRADVIEARLKACGVSMADVKGILLTHDHSDHVRYVYTLLRNNRNLKLFCTNRVINGIMRRHNISRRLKEYHMPIFKEIPFRLAGFEVTAFEVSHDGSDNMGFSLEAGGARFVIATDLGSVTERARHYMSGANWLVVESNYDSDMLRLGRYPEYLKARIRASNGHMDNVDTARFLREIINPALRHIFLCHLSQDNNTPEKALEAVFAELNTAGVTVGGGDETLADRAAQVQLTVLPRFEPTRLYVFRNPLK